MTTLEVVHDKETAGICVELIQAMNDGKFIKDVSVFPNSVDSKKFIHARRANKFVNDYAVTQLPFVLLVDEKLNEYAAVYSEETPITIDRINEKLKFND